MPTQAFVEAGFAEASGEVFLVLLTLDHADLGAPLRFVNNDEDVISGGATFTAFPFDFVDAPESDESRGAAQLRIDNVDRVIAETLRGLLTPPSVTVEIVLASDPDTIERRFDGLFLVSASWDAASVSGTIALVEDEDEPACMWIFTPASAPGLF